VIKLLPEIAANLIANAIFWLLIGGIAWLTYRLTLQRKFESLFGFKNEKTLVIYLSNLWDPTMNVRPWGEIIVGNELHAASEIQGVITGLAPRFPAHEFFISRHNGDETHEVSEGLSPAIVERVMVGDGLYPNRQRVAFMCVGRTGFETRRATEYLAQKWHDFERTFKHNNHFARCLAIDRNGIVVHHFDVISE